MAAIEVQALERSFGDEIRAVDGVNLEVAEGEIYAFLGPNGAGKTTTVRMLTTLLRPTGGVARVAGFDVVSDAAEVRRKIGVALQEAALDPLMTGRELIRLQATLHGLPRKDGEERAEALLDRVGLERAADRRVGTYSGGMRRRLDLASALVHEPEVLFLDEPTTGLDPVSRKAIWEEVAKLNAEGTTVFLTTQYLEEADQLADRVGIIDSGHIVAEGTPGSLKAEIGSAHLEVGLADGSADEAERVVAGFGKVMPRKDGRVLVELEGRRLRRARRWSRRSTRPAWSSRASTWCSPRSTTCSWRRPDTTSKATTMAKPEDESVPPVAEQYPPANP